jgi:hypothetical protein
MKNIHTQVQVNQEQTLLQPPKARFKHHKRDDNAKYSTKLLSDMQLNKSSQNVHLVRKVVFCFLSLLLSDMQLNKRSQNIYLVRKVVFCFLSLSRLDLCPALLSWYH